MEILVFLIVVIALTLFTNVNENKNPNSGFKRISYPKTSKTKDTDVTRYSWKKSKNTILEKYNYQCALCSSNENIDVHHIIQIKDGGTNDIENLIPLCRRCHEKLHHFKFKDKVCYEFDDKYGTRAKKYTTNKKGHLILLAIRNKQKILIKYKKINYKTMEEELSTRIILPLNICLAGDIKDNPYIATSSYAKTHNVVYVEAFCYLRKAIRLFRLKNIEILKTL